MRSEYRDVADIDIKGASKPDTWFQRQVREAAARNDRLAEYCIQLELLRDRIEGDKPPNAEKISPAEVPNGIAGTLQAELGRTEVLLDRLGNLADWMRQLA